jgi:hypothetical protein
MEATDQLRVSAALYQGKEPRHPLISSFVSPRTGMGLVLKRKSPCRESNFGRKARSLVTILTELHRSVYRYVMKYFMYLFLQMAFLLKLSNIEVEIMKCI